MFGIKTNPSLSRDFVLIALVIIIALAVVSLWVSLDTYETHSESIIGDMQSESIRIDRSLINQIENASYVLESLARQISQQGPENLSMTSSLLRSFTNQTRPEDIFAWIDSSQEIVITSHRGILSQPVDISDRDYIKKALAEPWKVQIGRPVQGRVTDSWVLPVCLGMTDYKGNHVGAVLAILDIGALTRTLEKEVHKKAISFAILSRTLTPLTQVKDNDFFAAHYQINEKLNDVDFDVMPSGVLTRSGLFNRHDVFSYYTTSSKYPYIILIGYDELKSFADINKLLLAKIVQILAVAMFLLTLLWIIRTRIIRPVESLGEIAADITRGKNFRPLPHGGPTEIEALAHHIKTMDEYIHERRRIEDEIKQKNNYLIRVKNSAEVINNARMDFLSTLAEELNKPIGSIREGSETLKDQHFGPLGSEHYLQEANNIHTHSIHLSQMIEDIHLISDMEHGIVVLNEKPVNLSFVIHKALRVFQELPQHRHVEIKLRIDESMPQLVIDEDRLVQILVNIFTAAVQKIDPGSPIVLECMIEKDHTGAEEVVIMFKYSAKPEDQQSDYTSFSLYPSDIAQKQRGYIRSGGINIALTRMLVSLLQGTLEANVSQNNVCRVYVRFSEQRIWKSGDSEKTDTYL
ncbi:MAG: hypothetical protein U1E36_01335 [Rickettsiales bacterium]